MPRGNPKRACPVRISPAVYDEVKRHTGNLSAAVEAGLLLWLKQKRREVRSEVKRSPATEQAST